MKLLDLGISKVRALGELGTYLLAPESSIEYLGWVGYGNLGDEALLAAISVCFPRRQFVCTRDFQNPWVQALIQRKSHSLAMLGGGTLIGEVTAARRFAKMLSRARYGVAFGTGVTPNLDGKPEAWLTEWGAILKSLPYVGVRSEESAKTLERVGVQADVIGDPIFAFRRSNKDWNPVPGLIGINIGHSRGHMYGSEAEIQAAFSVAIADLLNRGFTVEFFCVWPEDLDTTRKVAKAAGITYPVIHEHYWDATGFLNRVSKTQAFLGIKLHAVALALCAAVPSVMVEYRPKCREVMRSVEMLDWTVRSDEITGEALSRLTQDAILCSAELSISISERTEEIQLKLLRTGSMIERRFEGN